MSISSIGNNNSDLLGAIASFSHNATAQTASTSQIKTAQDSSQRTAESLTTLGTQNVTPPASHLDTYA